MIKAVTPAFILATIAILSASAFAPRDTTVTASGCDLGYGVDVDTCGFTQATLAK
jgi:hypothetical protein|tara:strand:- start:565 stop:729 length:165 start_codon:yes stop_codon:yes gene_type:complete